MREMEVRWYQERGGGERRRKCKYYSRPYKKSFFLFAFTVCAR